jgi:DNA sulfur modification protein DndB
MANKTFIPAFKAKVGDWDYYIAIMKYAEVARQVGFAHELGGNSDLSTMIQRGIGKRTDEIKKYLLESEHRFLGSLIIAVWGGEPQYSQLSMEDQDGVLSGIDQHFGVLSFDGTQQYFALDGQHRLKAIKEAIKVDPEIGKEDICVIIVSHFDSDDGKQRTRRLFTNINRNAKVTTGAENIVLDEDDGAAIITRRLISDHPFLSRPGIVKVFTRQGDEGELTLAAGNVATSDPKAVTTIVNLTDLVRSLSFDLDPTMSDKDARPTDEVLEKSHFEISKRLNQLLNAVGDLPHAYNSVANARELRAPKNHPGDGHPFMRPVIQKAVVRAAALVVRSGLLTWDQALNKLSNLDWHIKSAPWSAVYNVDTGSMVGGKENVELLDDLLLAHIAPQSKQSVIKARKRYKDLKNSNYPVSEADLVAGLSD